MVHGLGGAIRASPRALAKVAYNFFCFHKNLVRDAYVIHFSIQWNVNSAPLWRCDGDHGLIRRCSNLSNENTETLCGYLFILYKYWSNSYQSKCFSVWVGLVHKQPHSSGGKLGYHRTDLTFCWKRPLPQVSFGIWWVYVNSNNITKDVGTKKCCHMGAIWLRR